MKKTIFLWSPFILLFAISLFFGSVSIDPDFGWRLRLGNDILAHGIPKTDPYTYSMPSFAFIDHEWLIHSGMALAHTMSGYFGLAIASAILFTTTVVFATRRFERHWIAAHALLLGASLLHHYAVKPQIISWLFTGILMTMLMDTRWKSRWRYFAPLLLLLWANLHGGFIVGLGLCTLKLISELWTERKWDARMIGVFVVTVGAALLNPYGPRLFEEIIRTGSDARLRTQILEWTPQFLYFNLSSFFLTAWVLTIFIRQFKHTTLFEKLTMILLLIFGFSSSRNFPLWAVAAMPITARLLAVFIKTTGKNKEMRARMTKLAYGFALFVTLILAFELFFLYKEMSSYSEANRYPAHAIEFLKKNDRQGNILTAYEWGGYMLWKYPEKKVFIDGRMPSWRQNITSKPTESADALGEYMSFLAQKKPMTPFLKKYHITTILLPQSMFKSKNKDNAKSVALFKRKLEAAGYNIVYRDTVSLIYR